MSTAPSAKPMPEPDLRSEPFFDATRNGKLMIQRCTSCNAALGPEQFICSECLGESLEWQEAKGTGTLHTFGFVYQQFAGFENDVPYCIGVVELDEGPRLNTNVIDTPAESIKVGMKLKAKMVDAGNGVFVPKFVPA